jgi:TolB protein
MNGLIPSECRAGWSRRSQSSTRVFANHVAVARSKRPGGVMRRGAILSAIAFIVAAAAATTSFATAPGKNGKIAFRRYLDGDQTHGAIFVINPDGSGFRQLTHTPNGVVDDQPDWSSDGAQLAFSSNRDKIGRSRSSIYSAIFTVHADGSGLTRVSAECPLPSPDPVGCPYDFLPSFSPEGKQVVFGSAPGVIMAMDSDGQNSRVLVKATAADTGHTGYTVTDAQLSPNGKRLLFVRDNRGALKPKNGKAVYVASKQGTGARRVTPWSLGGGDNPDWSPDGKWVLFRSNEELVQQSQIYVIHSDGSGLKQLTHFKKGTIVTSSSFSPDGRWIVYGSSGVAGQADLYVMRADGTGVRQLTHTRLWESAPDWGPSR